jgi:thioredoxin reductase (NADPH)
MSEAKHYRVLIIGSGPAGYTAGVYAARANLKPILFQGVSPFTPGGQLVTTSEVENYPGFPKGVQGPELMELFREQCERFGTEIVMDTVTKVDLSQRPFPVETESSGNFLADAIIISTGANAKYIGIPRERELVATGGGVSACATCDGAFFKNMDVVVVGGGDTAMEEANYLTGLCSSVTIIHRRQEFRASRIMLERAQKNPKVRWILDSAVEEILTEPSRTGRDVVRALKVKNLKTGQVQEVATKAMFVAIGHKPNTDLFKGQLDMDEAGYLVTAKGTATRVPGVFACGDAADKVYRQAVTAAGTGCMAAIDAERFLSH